MTVVSSSVGRLQLFLGRLQLLVAALQLFVGRLDLLVGRLELLVGGLELLLHRLKVFARLGQLGLELRDAVGLLAAGRAVRANRLGVGRFSPAARPLRLLEQDQKAALTQVLQRNDLQIHPEGLAAPLDADVLLARGLVLFPSLIDRAAQRQHQAIAGHLQHVEARLAGGRLQERAGRTAELQDLKLGVHEHSRRRELADGDAVGLALCIELAARTLRRLLPTRPLHRSARTRDGRLVAIFLDRQMKRQDRRRLLRVDLVLPVHRLEEVGEAADGLRRAQQQVPSGLERVVKRGHRLLLPARFEIDQEVAAADEVHARERRVGDEVLTREDHHVPQRLADSVATFRLDEEPPQAHRRDVGDEALRVETTAGFLQQGVVDVRGEELQLARLGRLVRCFHERHGE